MCTVMEDEALSSEINNERLMVDNNHDSIIVGGDGTALTDEQKAKIEKNRQKALSLRQARLESHPYTKPDGTESNSSNLVNTTTQEVHFHGSKVIDTGGGFLLEEKDFETIDKLVVIAERPGPLIEADRPTCLECQETFADSYLLHTFEYAVCDGCRDNEDKHSLITKTDAKNEYLLKDCDLEKREPPLKFIVRKNPHNVRWGDMKLYLHVQVEKRALEVWGSEEELLKEKENRETKKEKSKVKKYKKQIKALRMSVRSSLYDRTTAVSHQHEFGPETYNEEEDTYTHKCKTCSFEETFEKM